MGGKKHKSPENQKSTRTHTSNMAMTMSGRMMSAGTTMLMLQGMLLKRDNWIQLKGRLLALSRCVRGHLGPGQYTAILLQQQECLPGVKTPVLVWVSHTLADPNSCP
eukprot:12342803-Prorocentrum_lima.AAC.1